MPVNIYRNDENCEEIAWLCDDDWELPRQLDSLEKWLVENRQSLPGEGIVADIGYSVRIGAMGGGAVLSVESMRSFADAGIEIHFSEYPSAGADEEKASQEANQIPKQ